MIALRRMGRGFEADCAWRSGSGSGSGSVDAT